MKIAVPDLISPSYFPVEAAAELGCFAAQGIDMHLELISPVERAYEAMKLGEIDFVAGSSHSALSAFPRWEGVKLLCAQSQGLYWFLVMRPDLGAKRGDLSIVKGKRIGAAPWVGMALRQLLIERGIDPVRDGVTIAPTAGSLEPRVNFGRAAERALAAGAIDGFWANGMGAELAVLNGTGTLVLDARRDASAKSAFNYTFATVAATDRLVAEKPDAASAVVRAIVAAQKLLIEDVNRAEAVGKALFPEEAGLIVELIRRDLPYYDAHLDRDFVQGMNAFARSIGILDASVPYEAVVAESMRPYWR